MQLWILPLQSCLKFVLLQWCYICYNSLCLNTLQVSVRRSWSVSRNLLCILHLDDGLLPPPPPPTPLLSWVAVEVTLLAFTSILCRCSSSSFYFFYHYSVSFIFSHQLPITAATSPSTIFHYFHHVSSVTVE